MKTNAQSTASEAKSAAKPQLAKLIERLGRLDPADVADLENEQRDEVLAAMGEVDAVAEILPFEEDSAGHVMTTEVCGRGYGQHYGADGCAGGRYGHRACDDLCQLFWIGFPHPPASLAYRSCRRVGALCDNQQ